MICEHLLCVLGVVFASCSTITLILPWCTGIAGSLRNSRDTFPSASTSTTLSSVSIMACSSLDDVRGAYKDRPHGGLQLGFVKVVDIVSNFGSTAP